MPNSKIITIDEAREFASRQLQHNPNSAGAQPKNTSKNTIKPISSLDDLKNLLVIDAANPSIHPNLMFFTDATFYQSSDSRPALDAILESLGYVNIAPSWFKNRNCFWEYPIQDNRFNELSCMDIKRYVIAVDAYLKEGNIVTMFEDVSNGVIYTNQLAHAIISKLLDLGYRVIVDHPYAFPPAYFYFAKAGNNVACRQIPPSTDLLGGYTSKDTGFKSRNSQIKQK